MAKKTEEETRDAYKSLSEREKQVQASFWAQLFLIGEMAAGIMKIREMLVKKGFLTLEEDMEISKAIIDKDYLKAIYDNTELAFHEKYSKIRYAMENPAEVNEFMRQGGDPNDGPKNPSDS